MNPRMCSLRFVVLLFLVVAGGIPGYTAIVAGDAAHAQVEENSGLFLPYVVHPVGSSSEALAIGDLNSDGRNDVVVVTSF